MPVVPAVLDALLDRFSAHPGLRGVQVWDGPPLPSNEQDQLSVGGVGDTQDDPAVTSTLTGAGIGRRAETVDVACRILCWTGDTDMRPRRLRAFALLAVVAESLNVDPTLGGFVARSRLAETITLAQNQTESGAEAVVDFTIRAETA